MKTVVLDDDPTGTQSASGVTVLLRSDVDLLEAALRDAASVYVQTNSRAVDTPAAVDFVRRVRDDALEAGRRLGEEIQFVLRGDSTLRGHVFAETEVFLGDGAVMVFVPAFPDGGRTTVDGVHYVQIGGVRLPAHETEFAADPVFPFSTGVLADYVAEKSARPAVGVPLSDVRTPGRLAAALCGATGAVVLPDAESNDDVRLIAGEIQAARAAGADVIVRSAAPLAAVLAGVESDGLLEGPLVAGPVPTLLVCGSHTAGAAAQLAAVADAWPDAAVIDTAAALADPWAAAEPAAVSALSQLESRGVAIVTSERTRSSAHNTLGHGERVMEALTAVVRIVLPRIEVVIAKGGITSADVATHGLGAQSALVLGQVLPGVSVWRLRARNQREILYVVVPGNVGDAQTLAQVLSALQRG